MTKINVGDKFGQLTVVREAEKDKHRKRRWFCVCECGGSTTAATGDLNSGNTKSCGCLQRQRTAESSLKHGDSHRSGVTRLYRTWAHMIGRCNNQTDHAYKNYGGRGIAVCNEWLEYMAFRSWALLNGYSDDLTIERIDVNGNYEPSNCCWIPIEEQAHNHRDSIKYQGKSIAVWAKELGINYGTIKSRINHRGWPVERAIFEPIKQCSNRGEGNLASSF